MDNCVVLMTQAVLDPAKLPISSLVPFGIIEETKLESTVLDIILLAVVDVSTADQLYSLI